MKYYRGHDKVDWKAVRKADFDRRRAAQPDWQPHWKRKGFESLADWQTAQRRAAGVRPRGELVAERRKAAALKKDLGILGGVICFIRREIERRPRRAISLERKRAYARKRWAEKGAQRRLEIHPPGFGIHLDRVYRLAVRRRAKRKTDELARFTSSAQRILGPAKENTKLCRRLRRYFEKAFHTGGKSARFRELLGCSISEARQHLERQFKPGMSWANHSFTGWHIDHRKPIAKFDMRDPAQQAQAFHFTNLQPLWANENLTKSDKW